MSQIEYNSKSKKKLQREMSKAGQQVKKSNPKMSMHPLAITLKQKEKKHLIVSPQDLMKEIQKPTRGGRKYLLGVR
jgi:UV DNA damage repair endonuclease